MPNDVYSSSLPFVLLMKLFGLFPLHIFKNQMRKRSLLQTLKSFIFVFACFFIILFVIFINIRRERIDISNSSVLPKAWEFVLSFELWFLFIAFLFQHTQIQSIDNFMELLENYDQKVFNFILLNTLTNNLIAITPTSYLQAETILQLISCFILGESFTASIKFQITKKICFQLMPSRLVFNFDNNSWNSHRIRYIYGLQLRYDGLLVFVFAFLF